MATTQISRVFASSALGHSRTSRRTRKNYTPRPEKNGSVVLACTARRTACTIFPCGVSPRVGTSSLSKHLHKTFRRRPPTITCRSCLQSPKTTTRIYCTTFKTTLRLWLRSRPTGVSGRVVRYFFVSTSWPTTYSAWRVSAFWGSSCACTGIRISRFWGSGSNYVDARVSCIWGSGCTCVDTRVSCA